MPRLRIFDNDPDSAPKPRPTSDTVGRFRSGYQANGQPVSLTQWRVTTGDPDVAAVVAELYGSKDDAAPAAWTTTGEDSLELFTTADSVRVVLDGPNAIRSGMVMWSNKGGLLRSCDGVEQAPDENGVREPCVCPARFADRKAASKKGTGCDPSIQVYFSLADAPELGRFKFFSGSWTMAREIGEEQDTLERIDGPAVALLRLVRVEYTPKGGPRAGQLVSYTKPVVEVLGAHNEDAPAPTAKGKGKR